MKQSLTASIALALCVVGAAANAQVERDPTAMGRTTGPDPNIAAIAEDVYIFGYPLVATYVTKNMMTNVGRPADGKAPINQVGNIFAYPTAAFRDVVAPNVNTLYSSIWLDLSAEPIVVHMPATNDRYYVMEILDMWTNVVGAPGKRTSGTGAQDIVIVGPSWTGALPAGITTAITPKTNNAWIINRIQTNGAKDYPVVNALQRQITTTPLSMYGKPHRWSVGAVDPSIDMKTPVPEQINRMTPDEFFRALGRAMKDNRPVTADSVIVLRMARIGLTPGSDYMADPSRTDELSAGVKMAMEKITGSLMSVGRVENGWMTLAKCGQYGTDYLTRAVVAYAGLGCNLPEDAIYPTTKVDASGQTLTGADRYVVHFPAGQTPPVKAFWSITMYDKDHFLVENPINRSAISSWNGMKKNADGSMDIYIQHASPGADKQSNWLPAPAGDFVLMMRLYWPTESAISGAWRPPAVTKRN